MDFKDIIGHEVIINNFLSALEKDSIAQSYIFEGPKSIGKKTTAVSLAKKILEDDSSNPVDLFVLENDKLTIKDEEIENLQKDIKVKPFKGNKKVYIIKDAEKMTVRAQNRFLKTLEEPPSYATIILTTTNKNSLLQTIRSRCQIIMFNYVSLKKIEDLLINKYDVPLEKTKFISSFSNGVVGRAIKLSQDENFEILIDETIKAINSTILESREKIFTTSEFFEKNKDYIDDILDIMLFYFRDLVIYRESKSEINIINKNKLEFIKTHCNQLEKSALHDIIDLILETKENIKLKVNFSLNIEMMLLEIQEGKRWQL